MPNPDKNLILVKGVDKTTSVESWRFDKNKPVVFITYMGGKSYPYNTADVQLSLIHIWLPVDRPAALFSVCYGRKFRSRKKGSVAA